MTLQEVSDASRIVQEAAHPESHIIFGSVFDDRMEDKLKITVIATGFESRYDDAYRSNSSETDWAQPVPAATSRQVLEEEVFDRPLAETPTSKEDSDILDVPAFLRHQMEG
jgi:cell division protein FtsZ